MKRLIIALATFSFLLPLSGCGQSGPLYLPDDPSRIEVAPPAEAEEDGKKPAEAPPE